MKLNLNFKFTNLAGEEMNGLNAAQFLADKLSIKTKYFSAGKAMIIATSLYKDNMIEIDAEDIKILEQELMEKDSPIYQGMANNWADQILKAIENAKKKSETETVSKEKTKK